MDFQLSEDQSALRAGIRSFCDGRVPIDALRELEKGFDRALWGELAEMGVFSLRLSESAGGVGLGSADAVIVFAELGRRLVPGPIVWTHLAADLVEGAAAEVEALWALIKYIVSEAAKTGVPGATGSCLKLYYTELKQRIGRASCRERV